MAEGSGSWNSPELLFALVVASANDTKCRSIGIPAYLFASEAGIDGTIIRAGSELYLSSQAGLLVIDTTPDGYTDHYPTTWKGFKMWRRMLKERGVREEDVYPLINPPANPSGSKPPLVHTASEAREIVNMAKREKWEEFYIVSHPIHILRSFACVVTAIVKEQLPIRVFAHTGPPESGWRLETNLNQGLSTGIILGDGTDGELARLKKIYNNDLDIAPAETILKYIKWRDSDGKFPFPVSTQRERSFRLEPKS